MNFVDSDDEQTTSSMQNARALIRYFAGINRNTTDFFVRAQKNIFNRLVKGTAFYFWASPVDNPIFIRNPIILNNIETMNTDNRIIQESQIHIADSLSNEGYAVNRAQMLKADIFLRLVVRCIENLRTVMHRFRMVERERPEIPNRTQIINIGNKLLNKLEEDETMLTNIINSNQDYRDFSDEEEGGGGYAGGKKSRQRKSRQRKSRQRKSRQRKSRKQ